MKRLYRLYSLFLVVVMCFTDCGVVLAETGDAQGSIEVDAMQDYKMSDKEYEEYLEKVYMEINAAGGIVWNVDKAIGSDEVQTTVLVPEDGTYAFGISYNSADHTKSTIALQVKVDGTNLSTGAKALQLDKFYQDEGEIRQDGLGNQFAPEQGDFGRCALVYPVDNTHFDTYKIELTKGEHTISIASLNDVIYVSAIVLGANEKGNKYDASENGSYYEGEPIVWEGETSLWKNSPWLVSLADSSSWNVNPADPSLKKVN